MGLAVGSTALFNSTRLVTFDLANTDDTGFFYDVNRSRRGDMPYIEIFETPTSVETSANTTTPTQVINLLTYPDKDTSKTPVAMYVAVDDIVIGTPSGADSDNSWVWSGTDKTRLTKHLSSLSLAEIIALLTVDAAYDEEGYAQLDEEGYYEQDED